MKILVILPRFPFPLEKGDKLRAYNQIRVLAKHNDIYLFCLSHNNVDEQSLDEMRQYCKEICIARISKFGGALRVVRNLFGVRSLQIGYWDSRKAQKLCRSFEERVNPDVIYAQMIRTLKYAAHSPRPKVLDFQDALSMNLERRMVNYRGLRYFALHYEFKMLRSAEYNATGIFDALTIISEPDSAAIPQRKDTAIHIVPNGVDFEYFHPMPTVKECDVVFCGNMQYKPNVDASRYLVNNIMPIVWKRYPQARVMLAGATPKASVRQLAGPLVTVTGSVEDIRPCYAKSKIFIAPMRLGSGLQNKLLEAMAMGIPCVTTSIANDSLHASDRHEVLIGNDAQQLADCIIQLLDNPDLGKQLVENASVFVRQNFSWEASGLQLESILLSAIEHHDNEDEIELEDE